MAICKPIVKFVVSLTSLIKKKSTTFRKKKFIKIWAFLTMEQSKIKLEELFFELLVQTFAFVIFFSFYTFNPFVCFLFLFLFVLTCLSSLGCQNVCLSDSTLFLCFQGFLGKYLRTHNFVYTRRLDYAHAGLFMRAQATTQKP